MGSPFSTRGSSSSWVLEGSANYFSNAVFPGVNMEWDYDSDYHPSTPIYAQAGTDVYSTSLYFQALEKSRTRAYSNKWVLSTFLSADGAAERRRLSTLAGFTGDFFIFARKYSLQSIIDTSGLPIPNLAAIGPQQVAISNRHADLSTTPFTIQTFELSLESGYTYKMSAAANPNQRVAYRLPTAEHWSEMPASIPVGCKETHTVLFLFVSTKDTDKDTVTINVSPTKTKCPVDGDVKGFILYPLQDPTNLNAYCRVGTHVSAIAACCCPDGSTLDEIHASTASICCPDGTQCYDEIVPYNMRYAKPEWVLWNKHNREIGCCQPGFVPTSSRHCSQDQSLRGLGFSIMPQAPASTP